MKKWENNNFFSALKNSLNGIKNVYKNENNIRIQTVFAVIAIIAGIILRISLLEFGIITIVIFMVFISEFFNTVAENIVDMITEEYNEKAKIAKDISAAAVTLSAIMSVIVGIIIFLPKIINVIKFGV